MRTPKKNARRKSAAGKVAPASFNSQPSPQYKIIKDRRKAATAVAMTSLKSDDLSEDELGTVGASTIEPSAGEGEVVDRWGGRLELESKNDNMIGEVGKRKLEEENTDVAADHSHGECTLQEGRLFPIG